MDSKKRDQTGKFECENLEPLGQPLTVKVPRSLDELIRAMPDRSQWLRAAIEEKAVREGLWEKL
jgi:hypothetical protein